MPISVLFALWVVLVIVGCKPGYLEKTARFADRVKSIVNPDELQMWATNLLAVRATGRTTIAPEEIPQFIRSIDTNQLPDIEFSSSGDAVQLWYGSGHGHWGIYVGTTNFLRQSTETHYFVEWKPGIYFWSGP